MPCQLLALTRALFSSASTRRRCQSGDLVSDDEKAALFQEEQESLDEGIQDQEIPFPCPAFMNTASQYILPQTSSHQYQYIPTPRTSSFSSSNHKTYSSSSSTYQNSAITIDPTPLAHAFANLAVDAGIYGTRDSYVEVLAFQLRRMVRSLAGQCSESTDGCLTLQVTRPELNCTVHITIETRRRARTYHSLLSPLSRLEDEQVVILALKPLVAPVEVQTGLEQCEAVEGEHGDPEGVFSTWWVKESRFSYSGSRTGQVRWRCSVVRGRDAWWDLHDICALRRATLGSGCGKERREREKVEKRTGDDWESGNGGKGRRGRCSRVEILRDEKGGYGFSCERVRGGPW